jgi:hypothetical protein
MAELKPMPPITIDVAELRGFGQQWTANGGALSRTPPYSSGQLGLLLDAAVGSALAEMLGDIPIVAPSGQALIPAVKDCVEVGPFLVVGGIRPQQFDVGYRPDGVRFAFDSKTLNDSKSVNKNWQNMINDLATEAATVHSRFPHAVVAFMVAIPRPCLATRQQNAIIGRLEGLAQREGVADPVYAAEAITLLVWDPSTGQIDPSIPELSSRLRVELFSQQVESAYGKRYKGLQPHA